MKSSLASTLIASTTLLFVACEQKPSSENPAPQPKGSGTQIPNHRMMSKKIVGDVLWTIGDLIEEAEIIAGAAWEKWPTH